MLGAEQVGCQEEVGKFAFIITEVKLFVAILEMTAMPKLPCL